MKGCYDTEAHYAYYINEALKLSGYVFGYDEEILMRQKRYRMIVQGTVVKYIIIRDIKLAYILGIDYESIGKKLVFENGKIDFEKKMFIMLHHELNIYCSQMTVPNYVGLKFE